MSDSDYVQGKVARARPAQREDISHIAKNMRKADRRELRDGSGAKPLEALERSFNESAKCWTMLIDDEPVAMFGVGTIADVPYAGAAWFLATEKLARDKAARNDLRKYSRHYVELMQEGYTFVGNAVDCRNSDSIRWLKALGFSCQDIGVNRRSNKTFAVMLRTVDV